MDLNLADLIALLGPDFALRIINEVRPDSDYLLESLLPEIGLPTYEAKAGAMTVRATAAGLVGMDSPFPPGGAVGGSSFNESLAKVAQHIPLPEKVLRTLQQLSIAARNQGSSNQTAIDTILDFANKVLRQGQTDTAEWMRGKALSTGALQWTFGDITLDVDYGFPSDNLFSQETGTDFYGGSSSDFWADWWAMLAIFRGQLRAAYAHPDTINLIISNTVNAITLTEQDFTTGTASFVKFTGDASTGPRNASSDVRDRARIIGYGLEVDVLDPTDPANPSKEPVIPRGLIVCVGNPVNRGMTVGLGSAVESETNAVRLGYTHIGPTTEDGSGLGRRWSQVFTPENMPMQVHGRTAANILPVIEAYDKVVVLSTAMS